MLFALQKSLSQRREGAKDTNSIYHKGHKDHEGQTKFFAYFIKVLGALRAFA
jgi:hypothetical protein